MFWVIKRLKKPLIEQHFRTTDCHIDRLRDIRLYTILTKYHILRSDVKLMQVHNFNKYFVTQMLPYKHFYESTATQKKTGIKA
jgi:hypothetical protein